GMPIKVVPKTSSMSVSVKPYRPGVSSISISGGQSSGLRKAERWPRSRCAKTSRKTPTWASVRRASDSPRPSSKPSKNARQGSGTDSGSCRHCRWYDSISSRLNCEAKLIYDAPKQRLLLLLSFTLQEREGNSLSFRIRLAYGNVKSKNVQIHSLKESDCFFA